VDKVEVTENALQILIDIYFYKGQRNWRSAEGTKNWGFLCRPQGRKFDVNISGPHL
jgi:hypothetical protein